MLTEMKVLYDLFQDLRNHRSSENSKLLQEKVEPLWKAFQTVHENYMSTFKKYLEMNERGILPQLILDEIAKDSIFSNDMRAELSNLIGYSIKYWSGLGSATNGFVNNLLYYIETYFQGLENIQYIGKVDMVEFLQKEARDRFEQSVEMANVIRFDVIVELKNQIMNSNQGDESEALQNAAIMQILLRSVHSMQSHYQDCHRVYLKVKEVLN